MENKKETKSTTKTTKKGTTKKTTKPLVEKTVAASPTLPEKVDPHRLVTCMSVTYGELIFTSNKTHNTYHWGGYGDMIEVEFQYLKYLKGMRSQFLYYPHFIIMEDVFDALRDDKLKSISEFYSQYDSMEDFLLSDDTTEIERVLTSAPEGFLNTAYYTANNLIKTGTLDSIYIVKLLNKLLGVNLGI